MTVAVSLPEEAAHLATSEGGELDRAVTAVVVFYHYERGRLSAGKAAELLGVARDAFEQMRVERGIDRPFSNERDKRGQTLTFVGNKPHNRSCTEAQVALGEGLFSHLREAAAGGNVG